LHIEDQTQPIKKSSQPQKWQNVTISLLD